MFPQLPWFVGVDRFVGLDTGTRSVLDGFLTSLLTNAVLVLPLVLLALAVDRWARRPALAHVLWVLALAKLVTPPAFSLGVIVESTTWPRLAAVMPAAEAPLETGGPWAGFSLSTSPAPLSVRSQQAILAGSQPDLVRQPPIFAPRSTQWLAWANSFDSAVWVFRTGGELLCLLTWFGGITVVLAIYFRQLRGLLRLISQRGVIDREASARAHALCRGGIRRAPPVVLIDDVISPALLGIGPWTYVLFPRALWETLPAAQVDRLLLHELEHYRRLDHWTRGLELFTTALFWWHPAVWLAKRQLCWNEELCCDAAASAGPANLRRNYAEALLATIEFISERTGDRNRCLVPPALTTGIGLVPQMEFRLRNIMQQRAGGPLSLRTRMGILLWAVVILPLNPWCLSNPARFVEISPASSASISSGLEDFRTVNR